MDDNMFDEDDALDYIFYEEFTESEEESDGTGSSGGSGCLSVFIGLMLLPSAAVVILQIV